MLGNRIDEGQLEGILPSIRQSCTTEITVRLATAGTCPKFNRCSAAYCPAGLGTHVKGDKVCSFLLESVKAGGQALLRGYLPNDLAGAVISEGLRHLNSAGPLRRALQRASEQGSRMESIGRASALRGAGRA